MVTCVRILVTFAVEWEFKPWSRLRRFRKAQRGTKIFQTRIAESGIVVAVTGVGPVSALRSVRAAMDEAPDLCIASGLAGGLKHEYRPGDVLVARATCSEAGDEAFESDERLFELAVKCGAKPVNRFVSTEHVVRTAKRKSELHPTADAVDMESFTIMKEMSALGVPCVAIRCVADSVDMEVPCDFERALDASGHIRILPVLGQVASDPRQAWPLARFGVRSSRAASTLARFLDRCVAQSIEQEERMGLSVQQSG